MEMNEYTCVHQVSPPCVLYWASYSSEEVILKKIAWGYYFVGDCHGNNWIHVHTKFHLHVCYTEQVIGAKKLYCLRLLFVGGCHGNNWIHMRTKFHHHVCYTYKLDAEVAENTWFWGPREPWNVAFERSEDATKGSQGPLITYFPRLRRLTCLVSKTRLKTQAREKTRSTADSFGRNTRVARTRSLPRPPCSWHSTVMQAAMQRSLFLTLQTGKNSGEGRYRRAANAR